MHGLNAMLFPGGLIGTFIGFFAGRLSEKFATANRAVKKNQAELPVFKAARMGHFLNAAIGLLAASGVLIVFFLASQPSWK